MRVYVNGKTKQNKETAILTAIEYLQKNYSKQLGYKLLTKDIAYRKQRMVALGEMIRYDILKEGVPEEQMVAFLTDSQ